VVVLLFVFVARATRREYQRARGLRLTTSQPSPNAWRVPRLTKRTHPKTGETMYQLVVWSPAGVAPREAHGTTGTPLRSLKVFADRVEVQESWCFSSGHAELYDDGPLIVHSLAEPAALPAVAQAFGPEIAAEVERLLGDPTAFAARGDSGRSA
jgi:hypothetical protein